VLAFRVHYALTTARADREWEQRELERLRTLFPARPDAPEIVVDSPNAAAAERFIRECRPDVVIARCKTILKEQVFSIPVHGTFVMHPGICPEYRNAHGCFWAMASGDHANVGMTLLRIDRGVDTGPVFGYFRVTANPSDSHIVTQHRSVHDHLDGIREVLTAVARGTAKPLETRGRRSAAWGQPWLTAYLRMRLGRAERPALQS
jgi:methionyl-tRNA formyltransferase